MTTFMYFDSQNLSAPQITLGPVQETLQTQTVRPSAFCKIRSRDPGLRVKLLCRIARGKVDQPTEQFMDLFDPERTVRQNTIKPQTEW